MLLDYNKQLDKSKLVRIITNRSKLLTSEFQTANITNNKINKIKNYYLDIISNLNDKDYKLLYIVYHSINTYIEYSSSLINDLKYIKSDFIKQDMYSTYTKKVEEIINTLNDNLFRRLNYGKEIK